MANKRRSTCVRGTKETLIKKRRAHPTTRTRYLRVRMPPRKLWFDILPSIVRYKIASYVSGGHQTDAALSFAQTNHIQRQAVLTSLSHKLCLSLFNKNGAQWMEVFGNEIQTLVVEDDYKGLFILGSHPDPITFMGAASLRRAEILDDPAVLKAVSMSTSIRDMKVTIYGIAPHESLIETLACLKLSSLELVCVCLVPNLCPFNRYFQRNALLVRLVNNLQNLTSLKIGCVYHSTCHASLWKTMPKFPKLRQITVSTDPPENTIPYLRRIESIEICSAPRSFQLAMKLHWNVISLTSSERLHATHIASLAKCHRLAFLSADVHEGAEQSLRTLFNSGSSLRSLNLKWPERNYPGYFTQQGFPPSLVETNSEVLFEAFSCGAHLNELSLLNVRVAKEVLKRILSILGARLKHFGISIWGQIDQPFSYLQCLMHSLSVHAPELRTFYVAETASCEKHLLRESYVTSTSFEERQEQLFQFRHTLNALKRSAPMAETRKLEAFVCFLHDIPAETFFRIEDSGLEVPLVAMEHAYADIIPLPQEKAIFFNENSYPV